MNFFLITLFGFFLAVQASPLFVPRNKLDVWVPTITNPKQNTVWHIGASETVTWYVISSRQKVLIAESSMIQGTTAIPPKLSRMGLLSHCINQILVRVLSCFLSIIAPDIRYLAALPAVILAEFFNLRSGSQVVTVPDFIIPGEYQITRESVLVTNYHLNL